MVNYLASYKELLLFEEFWVIAFRAKSDLKDSILHNHDGEFQLFHQNIRFWFADPFLFEYEGATYLFYEMFDRIKRKGVIGYSKFENNVLSKPTVILEDSFHLSFPFVYKKGNDIFMIPECSESNKITLYKAESFPHKWIEDKVLMNNIKAMDTILYNHNDNLWLFTSESVSVDVNMQKLSLYFFDKESELKPHPQNPINIGYKGIRSGGEIFRYRDSLIRTTQDCSNGNYGGYNI